MVRFAGWVIAHLALSLIPLRAADFSISLSNSPSTVVVGGTQIYNVAVTNVSGNTLASVFVTNTLPASFTLVSYATSLGTVTQSGQKLTVLVLALADGAVINLTISGTPTASGFLTNQVDATAPAATLLSTNLITTSYSGRADLGVSIVPPAQNVLLLDQVTYTVNVTNYGPDAVSDVLFTNTIPTNAVFISSSPTTTNTASSLGRWINLGTLASGAGTQLQFTVEPTNTGTMTLSATAVAATSIDTNSVNDVVSTNLTVVPSLPGVLTVVSSSSMTFNPQTGLMEQTVRLQNTGATVIGSARLTVSNLTARLYNASGTNNGNPYVVYGGSMAVGDTVDLVLEYFVPSRTPVTGHAFIAYEVTPIDLTPPATSAPNISLVSLLSPGHVLIEFVAVAGSRYAIVYSDNSGFTNAHVAQPILTAPANRVQWIDDGPPKTLSSPVSASSRFYRVVATP